MLGAFSALPDLDACRSAWSGLILPPKTCRAGARSSPETWCGAWTEPSIEVTNTDAEGRAAARRRAGLRARRFAPSAVVDLATLTGRDHASRSATAAGLFTGDEALASELAAAAEASGERVWRMPLWDDYAPEMRSDTADILNSSGMRQGAACQAAIFPQALRGRDAVGASRHRQHRWAPVDRAHEPRGATGWGAGSCSNGSAAGRGPERSGWVFRARPLSSRGLGGVAGAEPPLVPGLAGGARFGAQSPHRLDSGAAAGPGGRSTRVNVV